MLRSVPALLLLSACATSTPAPAPTDWRRVATSADVERLRTWREAFVQGLTQARAAGHGAAIAREGALLQPDAQLEGVALEPGRYRCRTIKLGGQRGLLPYVAYSWFDCRVTAEGDVLGFDKVTGSQRPVGLIFPHDERRRILLGTLMLGDERDALDYGRDAERDMIGAVERVGERRWRIVLPWPRFESVTDVIELVPA